MVRKALMLAVIVLVICTFEVQADVIHSTWVGGEEGEWGQASNWDPARVPDNSSWRTYAVTIDSNSIGIDEITVGLQQSRTIDQLDCYGEVGLVKWTSDWVELILVDSSGLTNHGYLEIIGLWIEGNVTNTAGATLELEDMEIERDLYNQAGATIEVFGVSDEVCVEGDVENAGSMTITPVTRLNVEGSTLHNTGQINIYGGDCVVYDDCILDNNDTGVIQGFGVVFADQLRNKGQIYAYGGSLAISVEGALINTGTLGNLVPSSLHIMQSDDLNNQGRIEVHAGGGVGIDCNLVNQPNGVIQLLGGSLGAKKITQKEKATLQGFGGISVRNEIQIESGAKIKLTGPTNIVGNITIEHNAVLEISDGQTLITGQTTNNGIIRVVNGDVVFQGGYSGSGVVQKD